MVKNLSASTRDERGEGSMPGRKDPLEKEMATHSSILAWEIPWTEEPGCLWGRRVGHNWGNNINIKIYYRVSE